MKLTRLEAILGSALLLICVTLSGCNTQTGGLLRQPENSRPGSQSLETQQAQVLTAQANRERQVEVTVEARVLKMLPEDRRGMTHEVFLLRLDNGTTVKVAHDTGIAPRVPLHEGDLVRIHGEYIWNELGGVIHWTHHPLGGRHEGGWIDFAGRRYQ